MNVELLYQIKVNDLRVVGGRLFSLGNCSLFLHLSLLLGQGLASNLAMGGGDRVRRDLVRSLGLLLDGLGLEVRWIQGRGACN